jgi:hypothetical protein
MRGGRARGGAGDAVAWARATSLGGKELQANGLQDRDRLGRGGVRYAAVTVSTPAYYMNIKEGGEGRLESGAGAVENQ